MKKLIIILIIVIFVAGCGQTVPIKTEIIKKDDNTYRVTDIKGMDGNRYDVKFIIGRNSPVAPTSQKLNIIIENTEGHKFSSRISSGRNMRFINISISNNKDTILIYRRSIWHKKESPRKLWESEYEVTIDSNGTPILALIAPAHILPDRIENNIESD